MAAPTDTSITQETKEKRPQVFSPSYLFGDSRSIEKGGWHSVKGRTYGGRLPFLWQKQQAGATCYLLASARHCWQAEDLMEWDHSNLSWFGTTTGGSHSWNLFQGSPRPQNVPFPKRGKKPRRKPKMEASTCTSSALWQKTKGETA